MQRAKIKYLPGVRKFNGFRFMCCLQFPKRDASLICVMEDPGMLVQWKRIKRSLKVFIILLHGVSSPMDGVGLRISG